MTNSIVKFTKNISNIFVRLTHTHTDEASGFNFNTMQHDSGTKATEIINRQRKKNE